MTWAEWLITPRVVERARRLGPASAMSTLEDAAAIREAVSSIRHVEAACARYGDRECFPGVSYRELWRRVQACAHMVSRGEFVGIYGPPSVEWIVVDLMCLYSGAVAVPLHVGMTPEQLQHAIASANVTKIFGTTIGFDQLVEGPVAPPHMPAIDELVTLNFSSGSTGMPKGVMLSERRWRAQLRFALEWPRVPHVHVGYLPHSHISGRRLVYEVMMNGGITHFTQPTFDELRRVRPTILPVLPHLANLIHQRALRGESIEGVLGDRLALIRTGTAPIAPETVAFLEQAFAVPVANGYGSTELGSIAINGRMLPHNEYKLVAAPELGYEGTRGELYVRSPEAALGYWNDAEATAALFDPEGYVRTGDIVEETAPGYVQPLGRRAEVLRLSHGEFVNVSDLENLYSGRIDQIDQIFIYGSPHRATLLAVVRGERHGLRAAFDRVAREAGRPRHEIPRDLLFVDEPFILTDALKLDRIKMTARYRDELEAMYAAMDRRTLGKGGEGDSVRSALSAALGIAEQELADAWGEVGFSGFGGDSLTAMRFIEIVERTLGVTPEISIVLDPTATCKAIADHIAAAGSGLYEAIHGGASVVRASDVRIERFGELRAPRFTPVQARRNILLTGATGFLGRYLLQALSDRASRVTCLVRETDDAAARRRVPGAEHVLAADLVKPRFGLSPDVYDRLAAETDVVVHAGALVNHALSYPQLFAPNVVGTHRISEFAREREGMAVHFVSSVGLLERDGSEARSAGELWPERSIGRDEYAIGYATSKWASELLLEQAGIPTAIYRLGVLLPDYHQLAINERDAVQRLLVGIAATRLAPTSFYTASGGKLSGVPVDFAAAWLAELALRPSRGIYHVDATTPFSLDTLVDALDQRLRLERLPYGQWFERFSAAVSKLPEPQRSRSPHQIIQRWARPIDPSTLRTVSNDRFRAALDLPADIAPLPDTYIAAWIDQLVAKQPERTKATTLQMP